MYIISTRNNFWDSDKFSDQDFIREVDLTTQHLGTQVTQQQFFTALANKKILLVVHGYNNSSDDICSAYRTIEYKVQSMVADLNGKPQYDAVVGFIWPAEDSGIEYFKAKANAGSAAYRLQMWLDKIVQHNIILDVMTHSMGARVILTALSDALMVNSIRNVFTMAAAVNHESLEPSATFNPALHRCERIYVFHSINDPVLKLAYTLAEKDFALGLTGPEDSSFVLYPPSHVYQIKVINCKNYISSHSGYKSCDPIYNCLQRELNSKNPPQPVYETLQ